MYTLLAVASVCLGTSFLCSLLSSLIRTRPLPDLAWTGAQGASTLLWMEGLARASEPSLVALRRLGLLLQAAGFLVLLFVAPAPFRSPVGSLGALALLAAFWALLQALPRRLALEASGRGARPLRLLLPLARRLLHSPLSLLLRLQQRLRPLGAPDPDRRRNELERLADQGREEGTLEEAEWEVVTSALYLGQLSVSAIMTPRTRMIAVPETASVEEARDLMLEEGHLRLPVYQETLDRVVGILLARDLWRAERDGQTAILPLLRPAKFVPDSKTVESLLLEMRGEKTRLAIVLDEFGGTAGMVTLGDLLEELVGEIQDEDDEEPSSFAESATGEVEIAASLPLAEVEERLGVSLPTEVYETLGGFIFGELGHIPSLGDEVAVAEGKFRVLEMDQRRVDRVLFEPHPAA